jgi:hypothetical protein
MKHQGPFGLKIYCQRSVSVARTSADCPRNQKPKSNSRENTGHAGHRVR